MSALNNPTLNAPDEDDDHKGPTGLASSIVFVGFRIELWLESSHPAAPLYRRKAQLSLTFLFSLIFSIS